MPAVEPRPSRRSRLRSWIARHVVHPVAGSPAFAKVGPRVVPHLDRVLHRASGSRVVLSQLMVESLVLTTVGRRTGEARDVPLACVHEPAGSWLVVGSNFGKEHHPAWTANLLAHPEATVSHRGESVEVVAALLEDVDRDTAWRELREVWPVYDRYEDRSGRSLRVFRLTPR